jgi:hypothetical protein
MYELEAARNDLRSKCPIALREGYYYGKDEKLVRIIMEHIPPEYTSEMDNLVEMTN